jgi:transposase-like protein
VLRAAEGRSTRSIAEEVGVQPRIVSNWRRRLADHGLAGLEDQPQEAPNYTRHGTTTLFAALEVATGQVIAAHSKRLRRMEFLGSMNHVASRIANSTSFSTISAPTKSASAGQRNTRKSTSTSPPPDRRGSIRSRLGFLFSKTSR